MKETMFPMTERSGNPAPGDLFEGRCQEENLIMPTAIMVFGGCLVAVALIKALLGVTINHNTK
jgi:hypothetical protein